MTAIRVSVNGTPMTADVEPRLSLADYLRGHCGLTGTHTSCEHGVCGACTLYVDDAPIRSCITYAVQCDGRSVRTIEGHVDDPVMAALREEFSREHGLQCGFCTPGMLATALDIVVRLKTADETRIREELSGNICRCTGYNGIVKAIRNVARRVIAKELAPVAIDTASQHLRTFAALPAVHAAAVLAAPTQTTSPSTTAWAADADSDATADESDSSRRTVVTEGFGTPFSAELVWAFFRDVKAVAECLPGVELLSEDGRNLTGRVAIKIGPIRASFYGKAAYDRDETRKSGRMSGAGGDKLSGSRVTGDLDFVVLAADEDKSRVDLKLRFALQGPLAHFSRGAIVTEFTQRLMNEFARNMAIRLGASKSDIDTYASPKEFSVGQILWSILRARVAALFVRKPR